VSLNLTLDSKMDFGSYYCVSKNDKGVTKGVITIFGKLYNNFFYMPTSISGVERDPNSAIPPPVMGYANAYFGRPAPQLAGMDDICPPKVDKECPDCSKFVCQAKAKVTFGLNSLLRKLCLGLWTQYLALQYFFARVAKSHRT